MINTELILDYMKDNGLSKAAFCRQCKISTGTLQKLLSGNYKINVIVLFKIARVLNIEISALILK